MPKAVHSINTHFTFQYIMKLSFSNLSLCALLLSQLTFSANSFANTLSSEELASTQNLVKAGDKFVTLLGNQVNVGDIAPAFKVVDKKRF